MEIQCSGKCGSGIVEGNLGSASTINISAQPHHRRHRRQRGNLHRFWMRKHIHNISSSSKNSDIHFDFISPISYITLKRSTRAWHKERDSEVCTIPPFTINKSFYNMAIAEIKPKDQEKLKRMVQDSTPGQEKQLVADVRGQVSNSLIRNNVKEVRY